jgi:hypothetical protein
MQKGTTTECNGMMNISQVVRHTFTSEELSGYIIEDDCDGDSLCILESILEPTSLTRCQQGHWCQSSIFDDMTPESCNWFAKYGPALVPFFRLEQRFLGFRQDDAQKPILHFFQGQVQHEYCLDDGTIGQGEISRYGVGGHAPCRQEMAPIAAELLVRDAICRSVDRVLCQQWYESCVGHA